MDNDISEKQERSHGQIYKEAKELYAEAKKEFEAGKIEKDIEEL